MKFVKSLLQFWYDFVIGDDWKIAVAVVAALALLIAATLANLLPDKALTVVGGLLVVAFFSVSLGIDVRPKSKR